MYCYYNANPLKRRVNDCTVRAISLAEGVTWDEAYIQLSEFARAQAIMPDEIEYIDEFLERHFTKLCGCKDRYHISVGEVCAQHPKGVYLITMNGHITCCINGCIYDTFDPSDRMVWGIYEVNEKRK